MKKLLKISEILAMVFGVIMICGGVWGISFTHQNIAQEKIVTAEDATIPNVPLRGPLTLKAQADIIRDHTLKVTGGKTYAEMPRQIPKLDAEGKSVLDDKGVPVMVPNTARDLWITATTLTTALNLGILTYVFSGLVLLFGFMAICAGIIFAAESKKYQD